MTVDPGGVGGAATALLVVTLLGVAAGRAKRRWSLLLVGLIATVVLGVVLRVLTDAPGDGDPGADLADLYTVVVPPAVVFLAGWLCARGSWFARLLVIGAAALLLAAFPYTAAGQATAELVRDG